MMHPTVPWRIVRHLFAATSVSSPALPYVAPNCSAVGSTSRMAGGPCVHARPSRRPTLGTITPDGIFLPAGIPEVDVLIVTSGYCLAQIPRVVIGKAVVAGCNVLERVRANVVLPCLGTFV